MVLSFLSRWVVLFRVKLMMLMRIMLVMMRLQWLLVLCEFMMRQFRFECSVIIFVVIIISQVMLMLMCMLMMIFGSMVGMMMWWNMMWCEMLKLVVVCRQCWLMVCMFDVVCMISGNIDEMKIRKMGEMLLMLNYRMVSGIQVMGEMGCSIWKMGLRVWQVLFIQFIYSFSGMLMSMVRLKLMFMCISDVVMCFYSVLFWVSFSVLVIICYGVGKMGFLVQMMMFYQVVMMMVMIVSGGRM